MAKIKICGLKRPEDIQIVNQFRPDYIGFVFAESSRKVNQNEAWELKSVLSPDILAVGVFVNEHSDNIVTLCREGTIDMIQLHGDEDASYIEALKDKVNCPIIKAVRVRSRSQILEAAQLPCEYLLLDTYTRGSYGGSGLAFDRTLIPGREELQKPFFLAGGLDGHLAPIAVRECNPYGVDVSSAVESDGYKDAGKIKEFIERVRQVSL